MNLILTGLPGTGKSTIFERVAEQLGEVPCGYTVGRYPADRNCTDRLRTFRLEQLPERTESAEMLRAFPDGKIQVFPEIFDSFGAACLERALKETETGGLILMDEIGRFEQNSPVFLDGIRRVLDAERLVFAVLKKEPIPFHRLIRERKDVILFDLDTEDREEVFQQVLQLASEYRSCHRLQRQEAERAGGSVRSERRPKR